MRDYVEHFEDADAYNSWRLGIIGFFSRWRGFCSALFIDLLGGGIFAWQAAIKKWDNIQIKAVWVVIIIFGLFTIGICISFFLLRHYSKKHLELQRQLHMISHLARDKVIEARRISRNKIKKENRENFFYNLSDQLANSIKDYFRLLVNDPSIECAIRVADKSDKVGKTSMVNYCTVGWSDGFNRNRRQSSESIPVNEGLPRFFAEKGSHGVLIYHNIDKAAKGGSYKKTHNDETYPNDLKTFMVAPINGLDGTRKVMLGLMYVTAKTDPFREQHVDSLRAIADIIGMTFPQIMENFFTDEQIGVSKKERK